MFGSTGAREVTPEQAPELHRLVEELCARSRLPKPRIAVIDSPAPNAFATGRDPGHAVVAVTTGIRQILDRRELAATPLFIVKPRIGLSRAGLFSTHPPIEDRVRRLRRMAGYLV